MTNRIRDASKKSEVGRPKTEDRNRHGSSTRGDPDIRGKPTMGVGVSNSNITDLESPPPDAVIPTKERSLSNEVAVNNMRFPIKLGMTARGKPGSCLQWESRVLAAKKPDDEVGVFIPNGDCFAEIEAPPNLPKGKGQEKKGKESQSEDRRKSQSQSQFAEREVCSRSFYFSAPTGRNLIAQGAALCNECNADFVAPRLTANYSDVVAWGKNKPLLSDRNRLAHSEEAEKNRSLSSQYINNGSVEREGSFQSQSQFSERKENSRSCNFND